jgi:endoribonuclease Dicer
MYLAAKERNVIVCLGTGTGKTYIAVLLLNDPKFARELKGSYSESAKRAIFLAPTRPLVEQQAEAIKNHFPLKVGKYTGDKNVDNWDQNEWNKELEENKVLVMTPQILSDMLNHGFIKLNKVNLLIMDEVHWAAKTKKDKPSGHPFKQIMNFYHSEPKQNRPRVLGLTASLINCSIKPQFFEDAIKDLEKTCDSVCLTSSAAQLCATNPEEVVLEYSNTTYSSNSSIELVVNSLNDVISYLKTKNEKSDEKTPLGFGVIIKCLTNLKNILIGSEIPLMSPLGIWCADIAIDIYLKDLKLYHEIYKIPNPYRAQFLEHIMFLLRLIKSEFSTELSDSSCIYNTASQKMHLMLDLLINYKPNDCEESKLCGIIFVNQRSVAKVLTEWLNKLKEWNPNEFGFLKVGFVVGNSARPGLESIVTSFLDSQQKKNIEKFRKNELNLLVATSVLEEGLDVRKCNLIIRYDEPKTFREYLQSKGRARAENAYYYLLIAKENSLKFKKQLENYREFERKINQLCVNPIDDESSEDSENDSSDEEEEYKNDETNARITTRTSIALLYRYCQNLTSDSFTKFAPIFEEEMKESDTNFQYSVRLPITSQLENKKIFGKYRRKKSIAKRSAAFEALKKLYENKELDNRFLPISEEQSIENYVEVLGFNRYSSDDLGTGTKKKKRDYQKKIAQVFSDNVAKDNNNNTFYLHCIKSEIIPSLTPDLITFGAITSKPIVNKCSFPVFMKTGRVEVDFVPLNAIEINGQQRKLIEKFHSYTFSEVLRLENNEMKFSPNDTKFSLFIVPLNHNKEINWKFIETIASQNAIKLKLGSVSDRIKLKFKRQSFEDSVFTPLYRNEEIATFYYVIEISDLTPKSAFADSKKYQTFYDYYLEHYGIEICDKDQPLIKAKRVENFAQLNQYIINKKNAKIMDKSEYFVPELVAIHPFPRSLRLQAMCLPAILYRLNQLLSTEELRKLIHSQTGIGNLNPFNDELTLDWEMKSKEFDKFESGLKELEKVYESDDNSSRKKHCSDYTIQKVNEDFIQQNSNSSVDSLSTSTNTNFSITLSEMIQTLIKQLDIIIINSKENLCNQTDNTTSVEPFDSNLINDITENRPPNYGESFPYIFSGDIKPYILEKYDASINDDISGPTTELLLKALTLLNANDGFNLERLETIGDSFLKFATTAYLFYKCPKLDEGRLTDLRSVQICNKNLYHIGLNKGIEGFIVATKFEPKLNWLAPNYKTDLQNQRCQQSVSDKSIADSIEALIGAYLLSGGNKSAIRFMQWLGLKVIPEDIKRDPNVWHWLPVPQTPTHQHLTQEEVESGLKELYDDCYLNSFEEMIGYKFNNKAFLVQAFTHSSYIQNTTTQCYQRLEFLGDALLDYLITRHIFKSGKNFSPGELTDLRSALVNNAFFASIAVKFNFHKYLKYFSFDLFRAIDYFEKRFQENKIETIKNCFTIMNDEEVTELEETEVPKALGDIFESVAGAVFLDNGLSLDGVWNIFFKLMKPEIGNYFNENLNFIFKM